MRINISNEAKNDLEEIWFYTFQNWSMEQADYYLSLLLNEIEYIAQNPNNSRNISHIRIDYFQSKVKSHIIFYKINLPKNEVDIIRILHKRMDIESWI